MSAKLLSMSATPHVMLKAPCNAQCVHCALLKIFQFSSIFFSSFHYILDFLHIDLHILRHVRKLCNFRVYPELRIPFFQNNILKTAFNPSRINSQLTRENVVFLRIRTEAQLIDPQTQWQWKQWQIDSWMPGPILCNEGIAFNPVACYFQNT